jgi:hypothetical protein
MEAYCKAMRALEEKFYGIELNHVPRRYNVEADELAKIASGRITVPPNVFARDVAQPSVNLDLCPSSREEPSGAPSSPTGAEPMDEDPSNEAYVLSGTALGVPLNNGENPHLKPRHRNTLSLTMQVTNCAGHGLCGRTPAAHQDGPLRRPPEQVPPRSRARSSSSRFRPARGRAPPRAGSAPFEGQLPPRAGLVSLEGLPRPRSGPATLTGTPHACAGPVHGHLMP